MYYHTSSKDGDEVTAEAWMRISVNRIISANNDWFSMLYTVCFVESCLTWDFPRDQSRFDLILR